MSISWDSTGGLFTILGAINCAIRNTNGRRSSVAPASATTWGSGGTGIRALETEIDNIIAAYSTAQQPYYDGIRAAQSSYNSSHDAYISALQALALKAVTEIVQADNPQPSTDPTVILAEVVRQMKAGTQSVLRCAVAQSVTAGSSNVGDPTVICSVTGRYGVPQEYAIAESLVGTITSDHNGAGAGTATAGQEPMTILGSAALTNKFASDWPDGSGANASLNIVDPTLDASGGNLLTNSNFETFTVANTPDSWTVLVGTVGTDILKATTNTYASTSACLQFVGGSNLTSVAQTLTTLKPATVYGVRFWIRTDVQPAAGVLAIQLVDGTNTVVNDDAGTANTVTNTLSSTTAATWTAVSGFFRTPTNMPATIKLRVRLSTAMSSGSVVNIDYGAMTPATQLYTAGPYVAAFRGATDVVYGDRWTFAITNDRAGKFQTFFEQAFDMSSKGLILPSLASSNTIDEALIA